MRKSTTGLLALVLVGTPFAGLPAGSATPAVCFGKPTNLAISADEIVGSGAADVVLTGTGPTSVYGYGGRDRICGRGGHDSIWGGPGDDLVAAGAGLDVVDGGDGLSVLPSGDDTLYGGTGRDRMTGRDGADVLYGGPGDDTLEGDIEPHSYVAPGAAVKGGGSGHVPLRGQAVGADRLRGGPGDDLLHGDGGADSLAGGPGNDILLGGTGRDILIGGPGHDALYGGAGHDVCYVGSSTDLVQSCEAIRVHQPRLTLPAKHLVAPPGASVTRLSVANRLLSSRVRYGRCWCTTQPQRSLTVHDAAPPGAPTATPTRREGASAQGRPVVAGGCGVASSGRPLRRLGKGRARSANGFASAAPTLSTDAVTGVAAV